MKIRSIKSPKKVEKRMYKRIYPNDVVDITAFDIKRAQIFSTKATHLEGNKDILKIVSDNDEENVVETVMIHNTTRGWIRFFNKTLSKSDLVIIDYRNRKTYWI